MNKRLNRLMRVAPLSVALGVGAMMLAGAGPALAGPAPTLVVHYGDLNMATPEGVQELSYRVQNAAWQVCSAMDAPNMGPSGIDNVHCQEMVIKQALDAINNAQLTAMFPTAREDINESNG